MPNKGLAASSVVSILGNINKTVTEKVSREVSEWLKELAWKACIRQRIEGSNPFLSAKPKSPPIWRAFFIYKHLNIKLVSITAS